MGIKSDIIPEYYDSASGHSGPKKDMIPARYQGIGDDRTMNHLIKYYGKQETYPCNQDKASMPGESPNSKDWDKPVNFEGEFVECGKPTGKIWFEKDGARKAAAEAVTGFYGFKGEKLEAYLKTNADTAWEHADVN